MKTTLQRMSLTLILGFVFAVILNIIPKDVCGDAPKYTFGALQNATFHLEQNYEAGMRIAVLELNWDKYYPAEGLKDNNYVASVKNLIQTYKGYGYDIMLDFGLQYSPQWLLNYENSRFKNQYGDYFSGGPGENIVNPVFNKIMRQKQEEYVKEVFADLGTDFACAKIGWLRYGELGYPLTSFNGNSNAYWCYDNIAQSGGENLPEGITACPVPGWLPGQTSDNHDDARNFYNWYVGALTNFQNWMIATTRKYYQGQLCLLYPSWGTRPGAVNAAINVDLNGSTSPEINGEIQRAHDFETLVEAIPDSNVMVYCTWIDSDEAWSNDASGNSANWSPVHWLSHLAKKHSPVLDVGGENSGGSDLKKLDLTFRRMKAFDLKLLMWAFDFELYGGVYAGIADYANYINEYQTEVTTQVDVRNNLKLSLKSYPNPFVSSVVLNYDIPVSGEVWLTIYDANGREVMALSEGNVKAGVYSIEIDGSTFKDGVFIVRLMLSSQTGSVLMVKTLNLLKGK